MAVEEARRAFVAFVREVGGPGPAAKAIGCSRTYVDAISTGRKDRPGLSVAFAIERASGGRIEARRWIEEQQGTET